MKKRFYFQFTLSGVGESEGEALTDAVDSFCIEPGEPDKFWYEPVNPHDWDKDLVDENLAKLKYPSPGHETEAFSRNPCWLCQRPLAGERHSLNYVDDNLIAYFEWICVDCLMYVANGEVPESLDEEA